MKPPLRLTSGAITPNRAAPINPAIAPKLASVGDAVVKMRTPNAMDDGTATSIAANAPHKSPAVGLTPANDKACEVTGDRARRAAGEVARHHTVRT